MDLNIAAKATGSLATVMLIGCAAGYWPRPDGVLGPVALRTLSTLVMNILGPSLLISTFGSSLTPSALLEASSAVVWCAVHLVVAFTIALGAAHIAQPSPAFRATFVLSLVFGNAASLPLLLMTSLSKSPLLREDTRAFERAVSFVYIYGIVWWAALWSVGLWFLRRDVDHRAATLEAAVAVEEREGGASPSSAVPTPTTHSSTLALLHRAFVTPPPVAIAIGIVIGFTPFLRAALFSPDGTLGATGDVLTLLGQGSVPAANLILAGSLFGALVDVLSGLRRHYSIPPPHKDTPTITRLFDIARLCTRAVQDAARERASVALRIARGGAGGGAREAHVILEEVGGAEWGVAVDDTKVVETSTGGGGGGDSAPSRASCGADKEVTASHHPPLPPALLTEVTAAPSHTSATSTPVAAVAVATVDASASCHVSLRTAAVLILTRLVIIPATLLALFAAAKATRMPVLAPPPDGGDVVLHLVILVQCFTPSAQTILVLNQVAGNAPAGKAVSLLFLAMYPLSLLTMTPWLALSLGLAAGGAGGSSV